MGVTLHAYVEAFSPGEDHGDFKTVDRWWTVATWEFNKDYALQRATDKVCTDGWPRDSSLDPRNEPEHDLDNKQWCPGDSLVRLAARIVKYEEYDGEYDETKDLEAQGKECAYWPAQVKALAAAVKVLIEDKQTIRVLFGRA